MNRQQRVVIAALFLLLVANISTLVVMDSRVDHLESEIDTIREQNEQYKNDLAALHDNGTSPTGALNSAHTVEVPLPMYDERDRTGTITTMRVSTVAGEGTYIRVDKVTYREAIQEAIPVSRAYVEQHPDSPLPHNAVYVSVEPESDWEYVDGNSLQLPLALALIATDEDIRFNESVVATGGINENGDVTRVSQIKAKATAARDAGYDVFLVPPGQSVSVDGIRVVEVNTVSEAAEYALEDTSS